jgi:hypothetical protein
MWGVFGRKLQITDCRLKAVVCFTICNLKSASEMSKNEKFEPLLRRYSLDGTMVRGDNGDL